jgi:hypothetical protein
MCYERRRAEACVKGLFSPGFKFEENGTVGWGREPQKSGGAWKS